MSPESVAEESRRLREVASRIHGNIATKTSGEYVYSVGTDGQTPLIMAGSGSVQVFRANFKKRLAEAFFNLIWIADNPNQKLDVDECQFYLQIYDNMHRSESNLPSYLIHVAEELRRRLVSA